MALFISPFILINMFLIVNCYDPLLIDQLRWDFIILENKLWKFVLDYSKDGYNKTDVDPSLLLLQSFHNFDERLQQMPQDILYGLEVVQQTPPFLFLFSDLRVIHDLYDKFRRVQSTTLAKQNNGEYGYHQELLISHIVDDILYNPVNNVNKTVNNIFERIFVKGKTITELFEIIAMDDYECKDNKQTPRQVMYNFYNSISLVELKGYMMMQFAYMEQRLEEKGNYTSTSLLVNTQFEKRVKDTWAYFQGLMNILSSKLWQCDPKSHIKGVTYEELTGLVQGHIENEVDMNSDGTCTKNCHTYTLTENHGCYDSKSEYCQKRKACNGQILNCKFIESHMTTCIAPFWSPRRYEFVKYDSGRTLGKASPCYQRSINSWYRWFVHCSYCFCLCDQQGRFSDRYFNLRPVMADVANNRVVVGLRIVKNNRIIHLQIQEGKLLPYGYIDNSTVRWVPVDDYKITDNGIQNGEDFHTMDFKKRTLFLDDLQPQELDHVITGVRFQFIDHHLRFQVNVRGFDFKNGTLLKESYYIYGTGLRQKINIENADIPTYSPPSEMWSSDKYVVEFTHSSIDKDAAQTTVPFFDTQPVVTYPAVPLRGVGIYYKGQMGYGGFIAPKITTYDFSQHLQVQLPEKTPRIDSEDELEMISN